MVVNSWRKMIWMVVLVLPLSAFASENIPNSTEMLEIQKSVIGYQQYWLNIWMAAMAIVITVAAVFFVYEAWGIRKVLLDLQNDSDDAIKKLEEYAKNEKLKLDQIYKIEKDELYKKQKDFEKEMDERLEHSTIQSLIAWKRYNEAVWRLNNQLESNNISKAGKSNYLHSLGVIYLSEDYKQRDTDLAIRYFTESNILIKDTNTLCNIASCYVEKKNFVVAEKYINEALKEKPGDSDLNERLEMIRWLRKTKKIKTKKI